MTDALQSAVDTATAPGNQRNVVNVLTLIVVALVMLFTKGSLDEVRQLRADVTQLQISVTALRSDVASLQLQLDRHCGGHGCP